MADYDEEFKEEICRAKKECIAKILGCYRKLMYGKTAIPPYAGAEEKDRIMSTMIGTEINKLLKIIL